MPSTQAALCASDDRSKSMLLTEEEQQHVRNTDNPYEASSGTFLNMMLFLDINETCMYAPRARQMIRSLHAHAILRSMGHTTFVNNGRTVAIPDPEREIIPKWIDIVLKTNSIDTLITATQSLGAQLRAEKDVERAIMLIHDQIGEIVHIPPVFRQPEMQSRISPWIVTTMPIIASNYWHLYHRKRVRNSSLLTPYFKSDYYELLEGLFGDFDKAIHDKIVEAKATGMVLTIHHDYEFTEDEKNDHMLFNTLLSEANPANVA
jgi:hypothetical protein